jgi:ribosomal protein S18 acetylase RimI-like enzyme
MTTDLAHLTVDRSSDTDVAVHLTACDDQFVPPLSQRTDIASYAQKLAERATRFEAWDGSSLVGLVAAYVNPAASTFVTSVSVTSEWRGRGVAADLLRACEDHARRAECTEITLEVAASNAAAVSLYNKLGYATTTTHVSTTTECTMTMTRGLT